MKKILLVLTLSLTFVGISQDCSQLFISEYVEGWSNNKAIEIYNPTSNSIDLSNYFVARYSNGASAATNANAIQLSGTIAPYDVYVAVIEKLDSTGQGQEAPVWDSLQAKADGYYCPDYNVSNAFYWNGNDAILLGSGTLTTTPGDDITTASGFAIIDIFGKIGENPADPTGVAGGTGAGWSTDFPYNTGVGVIVTADHSLIRKATVKNGEMTQVSFFNPLDQWDSIPANTFTNLGSHSCDCNPASINPIENNELSIYPNPSNGVVFMKHNGQIRSVEVLNALGQTIRSFEVSNKLVSINIGNKKGLYFLKFKNNQQTYSTRRVIIK